MRRGYTLFEMVVVVALVLILAGLAIPSIENMYADLKSASRGGSGERPVVRDAGAGHHRGPAVSVFDSAPAAISARRRTTLRIWSGGDPPAAVEREQRPAGGAGLAAQAASFSPR